MTRISCGRAHRIEGSESIVSPGVSHLGQGLGQADEALQLSGRGADCLRAPPDHVAHVEIPLDERSNRRFAYLNMHVGRQEKG